MFFFAQALFQLRVGRPCWAWQLGTRPRRIQYQAKSCEGVRELFQMIHEPNGLLTPFETIITEYFRSTCGCGGNLFFWWMSCLHVFFRGLIAFIRKWFLRTDAFAVWALQTSVKLPQTTCRLCLVGETNTFAKQM